MYLFCNIPKVFQVMDANIAHLNSKMAGFGWRFSISWKPRKYVSWESERIKLNVWREKGERQAVYTQNKRQI